MATETAPIAAVADPLRLVLFGMPAAGKSSLLGALSQAARLQEHLLNGRLTDLTHGLEELRTRLYEEQARRTADEVVPYPVDYEPFADDGPALVAHRHCGAVVFDCDGRVANDLLVRHKALDEESPEGTLAREVLEADVLILVVDAAAPAAQIDADFTEFDRFLRLLEQQRGEQTEVAGLPVFLVLTKCDLLAEPGATAGDWVEKIEQRKRDVDAHFREFLTRDADETESPPFGSLDLHLWATAVKRPALAGTPAKAQEPYGVAELFRQCLAEGAAFRDRGRRSARRLGWTVAGASVVTAAMLALAVGLGVANRGVPADGLAARVADLRFADNEDVAQRLNGSVAELQRRREAYAAVRTAAGFAALAAEQRQFVTERMQELDEYIPYLEKVQKIPRADLAASYAQFESLRTALTQEYALPKPEWNGTPAARLLHDRQAESDALEKVIVEARQWYEQRCEAGLALWSFARHQGVGTSINWRTWGDDVQAFLSAEDVPPANLAAGLRFQPVVEARAESENLTKKIVRVRDLAAALGLTPATPERPAVLVIPRPPEFPLERCRERLLELEQKYPGYATAFASAGLPEAALPDLRLAARTSYDYLLEPGRECVLKHLRDAGEGTEETVARWKVVHDWLEGAPEELAAWRRLALVLNRLMEADAVDPVAALATFLAKSSFAVEVSALTVEIPFGVTAQPAAAAPLVIHTLDQEWECLPDGDRQPDSNRRVWRYRYRPTSARRMTYHPGEPFWATLDLRESQQFTWLLSRSQLYKFERLVRPPRLHKAGAEPTMGSLAEGVRVLIQPAGGIPSVPDLLPVVRLGRR